MKQNFTVRQGALDGVEAFLSVAQHRSFRRAAAELGVTPSAISQAVRALEARVGAALFIRTTRSVGLTEAGERFLSRAKPAFEELVAASEVARDLGQRPTGLVAPLGAARGRADPAGAADRIVLPSLSRDRAGDRRKRRSWSTSRPKGLTPASVWASSSRADMVAVRLTPPFPFVVVGSPDYLRRRKRPERIDDLRQHACLRLRRSNGSIAPWPFVDGNKAVEAIVSGPLDRARLPHAPRRGDPRSGTCAGARPARQSADCRRPIASAADALRRHNARGFSLLPGQTSGLAQAARVHRARQIPERRCTARRNNCAEIAQAQRCKQLLIWKQRRSSKSTNNCRLHSLANDPL